MYVFGGVDSQQHFTNYNEIYSPEIDNGSDSPWEKGKDIPISEKISGCVGFGDSIYIFGGQAASGASKSYRYHPKNETYELLNTNEVQFPENAVIAPMDMTIYIIGGQINNKFQSQVISYQALYTISLPIIH